MSNEETEYAHGIVFNLRGIENIKLDGLTMDLKTAEKVRELFRDQRIESEEQALMAVGREAYQHHRRNTENPMSMAQFAAVLWEKGNPFRDKDGRTKWRSARIIMAMTLFGVPLRSFNDFDTKHPDKEVRLQNKLYLMVLIGLMATQPWQGILTSDLFHFVKKTKEMDAEYAAKHPEA